MDIKITEICNLNVRIPQDLMKVIRQRCNHYNDFIYEWVIQVLENELKKEDFL